MDAMPEIVLTPSARKDLASRVPEQAGTRMNRRFVTFKEVPGGGWLLKTHVKTDAPGTEFVYDVYAIDAEGNIKGSGKTIRYIGIPKMNMETGEQSGRYRETEHFSKPSLADKILSELAGRLNN
jgi:hypothetical protein